MNDLINTIKSTMVEDIVYPFAVYSSVKEQCLLNVPVIKPLFIAVLEGSKQLGNTAEITCEAGSFIFLSDSPAINMRNIPKEKEYFAMLIECDVQDFVGLQVGSLNKPKYCLGELTFTLQKCLQQFVEWSCWAPQELWPLRKKEIIELLCYMGHKDIL